MRTAVRRALWLSVRRNQIGSDQLATLLSTVYQAFSGLGKPIAEATGERTPAVPIRRSVHRDYVVCLECGWRGQMLDRKSTRLNSSHQIISYAVFCLKKKKISYTHSKRWSSTSPT